MRRAQAFRHLGSFAPGVAPPAVRAEAGFRRDIRRELILLSAQPRLDVEFSLIGRRQLVTLCVVPFANFLLATPVMRAVPAPVR